MERILPNSFVDYAQKDGQSCDYGHYTAAELQGIQKVHAIVGGFHLGPAPEDYLKQVVAEIKKLQPDVLIPMHCSGLNFLLEARAQMPGSVINTSTGSRLVFSA